MPESQSDQPAAMRLDKWLWAARFFKTRSIAAREARSGHIRLNGAHVRKASASVRPGDVLTFPRAQRILVVRVIALAERRGPASDARMLYDDLSPPAPAHPDPLESGRRPRGSGRPTKAERRALDRFTGNG